MPVAVDVALNPDPVVMVVLAAVVMDKAIQITVPPVSQEPAAVAAVVSMPVVLPVAEVLL